MSFFIVAVFEKQKTFVHAHSIRMRQWNMLTSICLKNVNFFSFFAWKWPKTNTENQMRVQTADAHACVFNFKPFMIQNETRIRYATFFGCGADFFLHFFSLFAQNSMLLAGKGKKRGSMTVCQTQNCISQHFPYCFRLSSRILTEFV